MSEYTPRKDGRRSFRTTQKSKGGLQIVPDVDLSEPLHPWQTFMRECISFKQKGLALGNDSE